MRFIAFDLETLNPAPEGHDGNYNLGVTCIAAVVIDGMDRKTFTWTSEEWFGHYRKKMGWRERDRFLRWLEKYVDQGYNVVSWNGLGFDFRVLAADTEGVLHKRITELALESIDPFYQMLCEKGFGIGLETAANGLGVPGKTEGMDGLTAMELWVQNRTGQEQVLDYVRQDAMATANVYAAIVDNGALRWTSRSGRPNQWAPAFEFTPQGYRMLTVVEATMQTPLPDTSWMSNPWTREQFYGWTGWTPEETT